MFSNDHGRSGSLMDAPIEVPQQRQAPQSQDQTGQPQQPAAPISH